MKAEIIAIGTEILLGHIVNTNAAFLSQKLAELGIDVYYHTTAGDNPERLAEAIKRAMSRSNIVITSGGLGPTVDDITAAAIAKVVGKKLLDEAVVIKNNVGTAPGLIVEYTGSVVICLPGPPRELEPMFINDIIPYLKRVNSRLSMVNSIIRSRVIKLTGIPEIDVDRKAKDILSLKPPTTVGIYAKLGEVDLKIMSKADNEAKALKAIRPIEKKIHSRFKDYIFGYDADTLEGAVGAILTKKKKTLAVAESCTGGLISNRITNISGSSKYFLGGVIAYSNELKENILGVSRQFIRKYGAVSKEVALDMAKGVRFLTRADIGVAVTGIAGPGGGTKAKPVGLVYVALTLGKKVIVKELRLRGAREDIKFKTSQIALNMLRLNV